MNNKLIVLSFSILIGSILTVSAQKERVDIRAGNKLFKEGKYTEAEVNYKRALEKSITSYEGNFNLSNSLYKQQRYEDATVGYAKLAEDGSNPAAQANSLYNMGNSLVKQRKLDEAIEAYKNTLRLNPSDQDAKFNLAYAQKLKQEEDKKNQDNKDNKDQNKDQNQDQNKDQNQDQNQDNKDQNKDKKDQDKDKDKDNKDQDKDKDNKDQQDQKSDPKPENSPSREDAERMLKAVQAAEDKTKKDMDEKKAQAVGVRGGKNW